MKGIPTTDSAAYLVLGDLLATCFRTSEVRSEGPIDSNVLLSAWDVVRGGEGEPRLQPVLDFLSLDSSIRSDVLGRVFSPVVSKECPPYETEYHSLRDSTYLSQQLADIAGFYRAFGLDVDRSKPERADHLSLEIDYATHLLARLVRLSEESGESADEKRSIVLSALRSFLFSHLGSWVHAFNHLLSRRLETLIAQDCDEDRVPLRQLTVAGEALLIWVEGICSQLEVEPERIENLAQRLEPPPETPMECGECLTAGA